MVVPTSGTVSTFKVNQTTIINHAMRRAGRAPEKASAEDIQIAVESINSILSQWINAGFPLWTRQYLLLGPVGGSPDIVLPLGTDDVFHTYWRALNPWRGAATLSTGADGSVLFAGAPSADLSIAGPNPSVSVSFGSAIEVDTIGVLPGASGAQTVALQVQVSSDGVNWTTAQTLPSSTYAASAWTYFDLDPSITAAYVRLLNPITGAWSLNQLNFGFANAYEVEIGPLNIDDYWNLPNKQFQGSQPNSGYVDRLLPQPIIKIWPTPNVQAFYNGCVTALVRRYIQDPGTLTQAIEIPQRAIEALQWRLANILIYELPDQDAGGGTQAQASYFTLMAKQQRVQNIAQEAAKAEALFWAEERTRAPVRLAPNISAYTR